MIRGGNLRTRYRTQQKERQVHQVLAALYEGVLYYRYLQHFAQWGGKIKHLIYNSFHKVLYLYRNFACKGTAFFRHMQIKNASVAFFIVKRGSAALKGKRPQECARKGQSAWHAARWTKWHKNGHFDTGMDFLAGFRHLAQTLHYLVRKR